MNSGRNIEHPPGISLVDIYFVVFRHKWMILLFTVAGMLAATAYFFLKQPPYQSSAKLMIKYVSDSRPVNPTESGSQVTSMDPNQSLLNSEMQIISSFDLYEQVATNVGPEKVLAKLGGGSDAILAASVINQGLKIEPSRDSAVIMITFSHPDQTIVRPVLSSIIDAYREKHIAVHKTGGISDDFLMEQTSQLRQQIAETENELRMAKTNAGIIDVAESEKSYSQAMSKIQGELFQAELELAEHQATLNEMTGSKSSGPKPTNAVTDQKIPDEILAKYKTVCARLAYLQKRQYEFLFLQGYTEENKLVKEGRDQMAELVKSKNDLEELCPALTALDFSTTAPATSTTSTASSSVQMTSLPTRIKTLNAQMAKIQADAAKLNDAEGKIFELLKKKKMQEVYLDNIQNNLQQKQIDAQLGSVQMSGNIPQIEKPTPPFRDFKKFYKIIAMLVFGGMFAGLGLAFLIEFYLDRSIKRPIEVQTKLGIPFFISIPDLNQGNRKSLPAPKRKQLGYTNGTPATGGAVRSRKARSKSWRGKSTADSTPTTMRCATGWWFISSPSTSRANPSSWP
jgi:uncharacterized protein involved in exopolysaccharide biosynthesis